MSASPSPEALRRRRHRKKLAEEGRVKYVTLLVPIERAGYFRELAKQATLEALWQQPSPAVPEQPDEAPPPSHLPACLSASE